MLLQRASDESNATESNQSFSITRYIRILPPFAATPRPHSYRGLCLQHRQLGYSITKWLRTSWCRAKPHSFMSTLANPCATQHNTTEENEMCTWTRRLLGRRIGLASDLERDWRRNLPAGSYGPEGATSMANASSISCEVPRDHRGLNLVGIPAVGVIYYHVTGIMLPS